MASGAEGSFELIETTISVDGNSEAITFTNLIINQALADINSFSFIWRQEHGTTAISAHIDFYKNKLSKEITISIGDDFSFKGIITAISTQSNDELGASYYIIGSGMFVKLNEIPEWNSFYKKTLKQICESLNNTQGTQLKIDPSNTDELFYTVQYGQTTFDCYKMLAARYGEWLYYTGTELVFGSLDSSSESLAMGVDVRDLHINARIGKQAQNSVGFDRHTGEVIDDNSAAAATDGFIGAATAAGDEAFGNTHTSTYFSNAPTSDLLTNMAALQKKAIAASAVYIEGHSSNNKIKIGGKLKLTGQNNSAEGEYIITQIHHSCTSNTNYTNHFMAIPASVEVPPYTNPLLYPKAMAQPAKVVKNDDEDGLDRIKVRFPWMQQTEMTPWINVMTPYAGKDRGIRFLPEVDEEVQIDFTDNNAERPYMIGSLYTEQKKSGVAFASNHVKSIGSITGRRLEINDDEGTLKVYDNFTDETPKNALLMHRKDSDTKILLESQKDGDNYSVVLLDNGNALNLGVVQGGDLITEIKLEKDGKKITIHSKGSIELNADQEIKMTANNISIAANQELTLSGDGKAVSIKGMKVEAEAQTTMSVKGLNTTIEGSVQLEAKGGAMASLTAALVKIN